MNTISSGRNEAQQSVEQVFEQVWDAVFQKYESAPKHEKPKEMTQLASKYRNQGMVPKVTSIIKFARIFGVTFTVSASIPE